jgi:hypothetical protein
MISYLYQTSLFLFFLLGVTYIYHMYVGNYLQQGLSDGLSPKQSMLVHSAAIVVN